MDIFKQLLLQLILILLNAFFAATEIAVISLNEKKVKARAEDGDKKAVKMLKMIEQPTGFLSTIQIGITLAGFLGSAFAADNFADRLTSYVISNFGVSQNYAGAIETMSVIVITLVLSFFTLVLGELVPKRIAMRHKEKLAEAVCPIISFLATALKPIIWLLTVSTNGVLRLFGIDPNAKEQPVSEEDIVIMLDAGADEGSLDENDIEYIKNIFKLDSMVASDVMTPGRSVISLPKNATKDEILNVIEQEGFSRIPIYSENIDNIVGVLHARDYLIKHTRVGFKIDQVLLKPTFVPESAHLDTVFKDMQKEHKHMVIVVNEYGETAGIVTMEDILEELVGEIWDERDEQIDDIKKIGKATYRVLSSASATDFFEYFEIDPETVETEASTVNGWVVETFGAIPQKGETFEYENLMVTVTKADELMTHEISVKVKEIQKVTEV